MLSIQRRPYVLGGAVQGHMIQHQHAIVKDSHRGGAADAAVLAKLWRFEHDVIGLPFTRCSRCVHQWNVLLVHASCLAVGLGVVIEGIEHLYFVALH